MNFSEIILKRRAFKNLKRREISDEDISGLIEAARLAPSCNNNQPWRFTFVREEVVLKELETAYSRGNSWANDASLVIAVYSKEDLDCVIKTRKYHLFDTGIAAAFIMLKATEMELVAHPIAGFNPLKVKRILNIPSDMQLIALIIVGSHDDYKEERPRPERLSKDQIIKVL
ncbi:nitroreductase family protein [Candidatus Cloacimonadota bacterium]